MEAVKRERTKAMFVIRRHFGRIYDLDPATFILASHAPKIHCLPAFGDASHFDWHDRATYDDVVHAANLELHHHTAQQETAVRRQEF